MSTAMNFSSKSFKPRPPDKGAFPLDHFGAVTRAWPPCGLAPGLFPSAPRVGGPWRWFCCPSPAVARPSLSLPGECSAFKERFMECLRESGYESGACRQRAMAYLECRMERQLMANEPLEKLGFKDLIDEKSEEKREKF
ncbi:cytochrome c oxidase assembly protein COX19 isoform 1-T4 [Amazona ochrocephala]